MLFEPEEMPPKVRFRIIGIVVSPEFQLCRCYAERLYKSLGNEYEEPDIRPILNVEWELLLTKLKRRIGGEKLWTLRKSVVVFMNDEFLGDDQDLLRYISEKYRMTIVKDFCKLGNEGLIEHLTKQSELGRNFVYFTIAIDYKVIGSLLFQLYADLVPLISEIFTRRCVKTRGGYTGTFIQRIAKPSWIQCGGYKLKNCYVPCENYVVPHDRRGVLSMCHHGKHTDNSTQFFVTLDPTPWMDYKYVAFGQLIQGEEILKIIENIPTSYEAPLKQIQIVKSGEFTFYPTPDPKTMADVQNHLAAIQFRTGLHPDVLDPRNVDSVMLRRRYKRGFYFASTDMQSYMPFLHLPDYLIYKYLIEDESPEQEEEYYGERSEEFRQGMGKELKEAKKSRHLEFSFATATDLSSDVPTSVTSVSSVEAVQN